ncbi:inosine monophosphate dehydrogenase [Peniophora sp. CONT]|nr:inosine monophosphate dehydrogenase [Peniophora sp. CONT]
MSPGINTSLTRLLGIRTPIILPAMAFASGGLLASQVTQAGGFGFFSPTYSSYDHWASEFTSVRSTLGLSSGPLPVGAGFLGFRLDKDTPDRPRDMLQLALEQQVKAVWLSFGSDLGKWVRHVREYDTSREHKTLVFVVVNTLTDALVAINDWKVDAIIAQGSESGGHGASYAPPLLNLLSTILDAVPEDNRPPIIAAGGLVRPNQVAAMLAMGAAGTVHGTLFLACPASLYKPEAKRLIIAADGQNTVRSYAFDLLRGTTGWPKGVDGRGLTISGVGELQGMEQDVCPPGRDLEVLQKAMQERSEAVVWAGTGVGEVRNSRDPSAIVQELHDGAVAALRGVRDLIVD